MDFEKRIFGADVPETEDETTLLEDLIRNQVLDRLGRPKHLIGIDVKRLWDNCYRVNVRCAVTADSSRIRNGRMPKQSDLPEGEEITDSFFVQVSTEGRIESARPVIDKKY